MHLLLAVALAGMAQIPAGTYRPLYTTGRGRVSVAAFSMDRNAVSRGEYLAFVRAHPEWRKSAARRDRADAGYLADWTSDFAPGADASAPVTGVSWFAAGAYCAAQGKRLPTVAEWEYVAAADAHRRDASADPLVRAAILSAYVSRHARAGTPLDRANVYGVRGLHERTWEWTHDFNHTQPGHDSHVGCASAAMNATDPSDYPAFMRNAVRSGLTSRSTLSTLGFRCAA